MYQRKLGRPVRASTVAAIVLALLVAGCGGGTARPAAAASTHPTTSTPTPTPTPTPTKTGPGPMTAAELAWTHPAHDWMWQVPVTRRCSVRPVNAGNAPNGNHPILKRETPFP